MAVTALDLITRSYYLSQVVSRELMTVSGSQIADGLYLLNALLDFKSGDTRLIPYWTKFQFTAVIGQEKYTIPDLIQIDTMTFNIDQVRFSMNEFTRQQYFAISRVDNIQSLPFCYRVEREKGGCDIYVYFVPAGEYVFTLMGKFALSEVSLEQDLSLTYDKYYIEYIRYELANMICADYGATFPDASMQMLMMYRKELTDVSPPDISIASDNYFGKGEGLDWQYINLTTGYWPF